MWEYSLFEVLISRLEGGPLFGGSVIWIVCRVVVVIFQNTSSSKFSLNFGFFKIDFLKVLGVRGFIRKYDYYFYNGFSFANRRSISRGSFL